MYHPLGMSGFSHYYFSTSHRCITLQVCQGSVIVTSVLHIGVSPSSYVRVQSLLLQYFHIDVSPSSYVRVQSLLLQYFTSVYHPPGMSGFSHYYFSTSHRCITLQVCQGSVIVTSVLSHQCITIQVCWWVMVVAFLQVVIPLNMVSFISMYNHKQFGRFCRVGKKVFTALKEYLPRIK